MKKYKLEVTKDQLIAIQRGCEILARLEAKQYTTALQYHFYNMPELIDELYKIQNKLGSCKFTREADIPFEIYQAIRQKLAYEKNPNPTSKDKFSSTDFDEPLIRSGEPKVTIEDIGE